MSYQSPAKGRHSIAHKLSCGHQKSPYQIQRRNERERRRVHQVSSFLFSINCKLSQLLYEICSKFMKETVFTILYNFFYIFDNLFHFFYVYLISLQQRQHQESQDITWLAYLSLRSFLLTALPSSNICTA